MGGGGRNPPNDPTKPNLMLVDDDWEGVGRDETGHHPEGGDLGQAATVLLKRNIF